MGLQPLPGWGPWCQPASRSWKGVGARNQDGWLPQFPTRLGGTAQAGSKGASVALGVPFISAGPGPGHSFPPPVPRVECQLCQSLSPAAAAHSSEQPPGAGLGETSSQTTAGSEPGGTMAAQGETPRTVPPRRMLWPGCFQKVPQGAAAGDQVTCSPGLPVPKALQAGAVLQQQLTELQVPLLGSLM